MSLEQEVQEAIKNEFKQEVTEVLRYILKAQARRRGWIKARQSQIAELDQLKLKLLESWENHDEFELVQVQDAIKNLVKEGV